MQVEADSGMGRAAIQLGKSRGSSIVAIVRGRSGEEGEKLKREMKELGPTHVVTDDGRIHWTILGEHIAVH